ncbi:hypothetical protein LJC33_00990 [Eubacteriales bacterium OttesenSCG-928-N13]|nr:hypothetical protein [Eubacteriales bacterium OttesenSCG-928-N13]
MTQVERDQSYLVALSIFKSMHREGIVSESELVQIASFLADRFSPSLAAKTPEIA